MNSSPVFKVLMVEDDENLGFLLKDSMEMAGYMVRHCNDGQTAISAFINSDFDLCILDVMLPKKDGFTLAAEIRKLNQKIPLVFLTAKNQKEDKIQGFKIGADDYVTKPFSMEEFLLRIEAILKRVYNTRTKADNQSIYKIGLYTFDYDSLTLVSADSSIQLTYKEAKLLRIFGQNPNKIIERDIIQKAIWEDDGYFVGRSMDVFISRLRKFFKEDPSIKISNIHGIGYKLEC